MRASPPIYLAGLAGELRRCCSVLRAPSSPARERLPKPPSVIWRYALSNVHRPGSAAVSVILALGLGLTLFVTLALTDRTISDRAARPAFPTGARPSSSSMSATTRCRPSSIW